MTLDVHIVSHTHWDREWYHPLERFRQRLVALVDELLDDPPRKGTSFLLDGQAIVLEDYLDVAKDRASDVERLLGERRLEAGPWYVLADELIPSGEALVRNLLAGRRTLTRFSATSPPVLYCPDSFGHPAALPSIAAGFGFPLIILWRGYGGPRWPAGDTGRWTAPNGDSAILFHLPRDGYEFGSHLPSNAEGARLRWTRIRAELAPRSTTGVVLVPHGADHHARQSDDRAAIEALIAAAANDATACESSLTGFAEALEKRAPEASLPVVHGELRDSYGYAWTLQGTFATRAHEKRLNATVERLLLREAEPWSALAARRGPSQRDLTEKAWTTLLAAHPHDTLCGCSIDDVADAMELRLRSSRNQAIGIRDDAIAALIGHDPVAARRAKDAWTPIVVVRNPAPRTRSGVAIVDVEEFVADVPVGPGSAPKEPSSATVSKSKPRIPTLGSLQVLSKRLEYSRTESPRHYPDNDLVSTTRVAAWVVDAPAYGIVSHAIGGPGKTPGRCPDRVVVTKTSLKNANLSIDVDTAGTVSVEAGDRRVASLLELLEEGDVGDLYTPAPRPRAYTVQFRGSRVVHRGPLRGDLALSYRILSPESRRARAELTLHLVLDAASEVLEIRVQGINNIENHRVRLAVRGDVIGGRVFADAAFGPVEREPIIVSPSEAAVEQPPRTAPLHRYVSRFAEDRGFTVFSDGLAEYEARDDGAIAVTLVRGVGELSRNDIPERPGHAGWPSPTPRAQCIGPFEARLAFLPHGARTSETVDRIERTADDVLNPLVGVTLRSALAIPPAVRGPQLEGLGLAFSTIKESEDGKWTVLRCVNLSDVTVAGRWTLPGELAEARLARLDETIIGRLDVSSGSVAFEASPRAIVTILVR
jgi:alpha-mannosidase